VRNNPLKYVDPSGEEIRFSVDGGKTWFKYEYCNGKGVLLYHDAEEDDWIQYDGDNSALLAARDNLDRMRREGWGEQIDEMIASDDKHWFRLGEGSDIGSSTFPENEGVDNQVMLDLTNEETKENSYVAFATAVLVSREVYNNPNEYYSQGKPDGQIVWHAKDGTSYTRFDELKRATEETVRGRKPGANPLGNPKPNDEMFSFPRKPGDDTPKGIGPSPGCNFLTEKPPRLNPPKVPRPTAPVYR
jgi:hypothetical protein